MSSNHKCGAVVVRAGVYTTPIQITSAFARTLVIFTMSVLTTPAGGIRDRQYDDRSAQHRPSLNYCQSPA
jgi:hypothetical protein